MTYQTDVARRVMSASAEGIIMHDAVPVPTQAQLTEPPSPQRRHPGAGTLLTLVNGVLAGVGGVYVSTHSALITIIAVLVVISLTIIVLVFDK
jgi:hypothetical protein